MVADNDVNGFLKLLPWILLFIAVEVIICFLSSYFLTLYKAQCGHRIRDGIGRKILRSTYNDNDAYPCAYILSMYSNQVELLQEGTNIIPELVVGPVITLVAAVYIMRINLKLFAAAVILMPLSSLIYDKLMKTVEIKSKEILDSKADLGIQARDVVNGFYIMKAYNLQKFFMGRFAAKVENIVVREKSKDKIDSVLMRVAILLRYIPQLIIPLFGGYLAFKGEMSLGELIAANSVIWYILLPVESVLDARKRMKEITPALKDLDKLLSVREEAYEGEVPEAAAELLSMDNVSFSYNGSKNVLDGIDLKINRGDHVKILGESGCGKSTLVKLIEGIYGKYTGTVRAFNKEVDEKNIVAIRKKISFVPQHPYIFRGTIKENITLGRKIPEERLERICEASGLSKFIDDLTDGIDTMIGSGGVKLSGGQCQRISIARAMLKEGDLFIMDEPTSALDGDTEKIVNEGFNKITEGRGSIVITHRAAVISEGDMIVHMKEGKLYEDKAV